MAWREAHPDPVGHGPDALIEILDKLLAAQAAAALADVVARSNIAAIISRRAGVSVTVATLVASPSQKVMEVYSPSYSHRIDTLFP